VHLVRYWNPRTDREINSGAGKLETHILSHTPIHERRSFENPTMANHDDEITASGNQSYPQLSDIIFNNTTNNSFNKVLGELKRSTLSIPNRLRSIKQDANFVSEVTSAYGLPLVANERCGSWYIPPEQKKQSAYFKSTDGPMAQWSFSLRRLNLQVLETIGEFDGCVFSTSS
jgi:tRNA A64-2'-O-ribosylphosphate transferase